MPAGKGIQCTILQLDDIGGGHGVVERLLVLSGPLFHPALMWLAAKTHQIGHGQAFGRGVVLGQQGQLAGDFLRGQDMNVFAVQQNRAGVGCVNPGQAV